jgi:4-carboxymuconolactone decarboxylase
MDEKLGVLLEVSAALAAGGGDRLNAALAAALAGAPAVEVEEVILQSYLFLGYPAALRGLAAWRRVSGMAAPERPTDDRAVWESRGAATCARVYGGQYERLRANVAALHPDIEQWMVTEGYGKVLGRPALDLVAREACIVALLAAQDAAPQLYSHLRGLLNAGADAALADQVVRRLAASLPAARVAVLEREWQKVRSRRQDARAGE